MGDLEQVEVTPGAFPGCFPAPCGNTAVGSQGCGGWAINPRNVLWPGLQPSPCQAELSHSPEMQLHFGNPFSELVLLLLFLLKHSHGIFLIVQPAGLAQCPIPVELQGRLFLGMAIPALLDGFVVEVEFPELQLSQPSCQSHSGFSHLVHGIFISHGEDFGVFES